MMRRRGRVVGIDPEERVQIDASLVMGVRMFSVVGGFGILNKVGTAVFVRSFLLVCRKQQASKCSSHITLFRCNFAKSLLSRSALLEATTHSLHLERIQNRTKFVSNSLIKKAECLQHLKKSNCRALTEFRLRNYPIIKKTQGLDIGLI